MNGTCKNNNGPKVTIDWTLEPLINCKDNLSQELKPIRRLDKSVSGNNNGANQIFDNLIPFMEYMVTAELKSQNNILSKEISSFKTSPNDRKHFCSLL